MSSTTGPTDSHIVSYDQQYFVNLAASFISASANVIHLNASTLVRTDKDVHMVLANEAVLTTAMNRSSFLLYANTDAALSAHTSLMQTVSL